MSFEANIGPDDDGRRLDRVLRKALGELPLSAIHRLLRKGRVTLDGVPAAGTDRVRRGSVLRVEADLGAVAGKARLSSRPSGGDILRPLWEGAGLLAADKPAGMPVHGKNSLEDLVLHHLEGKLGSSLSFRPGPLHRLDQPTSGIVFFSVDLQGAQAFSRAMRERRIGKRYLAVLQGTLGAETSWTDDLVRDGEEGRTRIMGDAADGSIQSDPGKARHAVTRVRPLAVSDTLTLALVDIGTGRTHQIRAQSAFHGYPLAGDGKYGGVPFPGGLLLHAYEMDFRSAPELSLPNTLRAPLPRPFIDAALRCFGEKIARILKEGPPTEELLGAIL